MTSAQVRPQQTRPGPARGAAIVCIDFEGRWGAPSPEPYDLEEAAEAILGVLAKHRLPAVFFVVGEIVGEHPHLISRMADQGHEVGLHGWRHERMDKLSASDLQRVGEGLRASAEEIESLTGRRPTGFRAPHLLAPEYYDQDVYRLLAQLGFRWVSNREVRQPFELARPDRLHTQSAVNLLNSRPWLLDGPVGKALLITCNAGLVATGAVGGSPRSAAAWLRDGYPPFHRDGLLEVPVSGPLDCDLLGFPSRTTPSPKSMLDFARCGLRAALRGPGRIGMVTFHDWLITGANRLGLMDRVLGMLTNLPLRVVTVSGDWAAISALAGDRVA